MELLIISSMLPYPLDGGGKHGMYHMIDKLRKEENITLLTITKKEQETDLRSLQELWPDVEFKSYIEKETGNKSLTKKIKILMFFFIKLLRERRKKEITDLVKFHSSLYYSGFTLYKSECLDFIADVCKTKKFDFIQVEYYDSISLVHLLPENAKKVFVHHELRYIRNEREMNLYKNVSNYDRYLYNLYKEYELSTLDKYDAVITVSEVDKKELQKFLPEKTIYDSPSIISENINTTVKTYKFNGKIVFVGGSGHFPNYDAVDWFLEYAWETVYNTNNKLEFHVIGKWDKSHYSRYLSNHNNVFFDGFVDDLNKALSGSIMVVPIRIGSGMRMKILDAINRNVPYVTTSTGVEGLEFTDGKDCFIADGDDFASALIKLITDEMLQRQFMENAKNTLIRRYSKELLYNKRRKFYDLLQN